MGTGITFVKAAMHIVIFLKPTCRHLDMHRLWPCNGYQELSSNCEGICSLNRCIHDSPSSSFCRFAGFAGLFWSDPAKNFSAESPLPSPPRRSEGGNWLLKS